MVFKSGRAEIALLHGGRRDDVVEDQSLPLPHPLVIDKEKSFLFAAEETGQMNGPPNAPPNWLRFNACRSGSEEIARIQIFIAKKFEYAAVKMFSPDLELMFMMPPAEPNSAEYAFCWTLNSCSPSMEV